MAGTRPRRRRQSQCPIHSRTKTGSLRPKHTLHVLKVRHHSSDTANFFITILQPSGLAPFSRSGHPINVASRRGCYCSGTAGPRLRVCHMCQNEVLSSGKELDATLACLVNVVDTSRHLNDGNPSFDLAPKGLGPAKSIAVALSLSAPLWAVIGLVSWAMTGSHPH